jgi:hypothetical protein
MEYQDDKLSGRFKVSQTRIFTTFVDIFFLTDLTAEMFQIDKRWENIQLF